MPYVRRSSMRSSARPRRPMPRRPYRKKGPSVTVKRRVPIARKRSVLANKRAIRSLSMRMYGSIQKCCVTSNRILVPTAAKPLLMEMSDFTRVTAPPEYEHNAHGGYIYSLDAAGALTTVANWEIPPLANVSTNPYMQFNSDIVDGGKYLALSNYVTFEVEGRPHVSNVRVRFQVFTQNMRAVYNTDAASSDFALPESLIHMKNLASFASGNFLPKKFFRCTFDKTLFINSSSVAVAGQHGTTANKKYITVPYHPRGGKLVRQRITAPVNNTGGTTLPEPARGYFGPDVRSPGELQWLLISTDDTEIDTDSISITVRSLRKWRDAQGAY